MRLAKLDVESFSLAGQHWNEEKQKWDGPPGAAQNKRGLPVIGAFVYWEHPSARVLLMSYTLPGDNSPSRWRPGDPLPLRLLDYLAAGGHVEFHNAMFEKLGWLHDLQKRHGFPPLDHANVHCSMATAHVNGYPGGLEALGDALGTDTRKDPRGKALMDVFSIPRKPTKTDRRTIILPDDPEPVKFQGAMHAPAQLFEWYHDYCDFDVLTEEAAGAMMEPMTPAEREAWLLDQAMNWRGIAVDRPAVRDCIAVLGQAIARYGKECEALTGGLGPSQVQALIGWIHGRGIHGIDSFDSKKSPVEEHLKRTDLPPDVRRVLEIRGLVGSAGVKKLFAMENRTSSDDRLRGLFVHHGTRTGRPTGEGVQTTNLVKIGPKLVWCPSCARPHVPGRACPWCGTTATHGKGRWEIEMVDHVLEIMACRSLDMVEAFFGDAVLCIQGCIRGLLVAEEGHELISSDYSAIEAVVAACITGEQWRIDTFKRREDIYLQSAAAITGKTYEFYTAYFEEQGQHHPDRQLVGKIAELACLAPETEVLTKRGYVAIAAVSSNDLLWDGFEWVTHGGLIDKGERSIVSLDGVRMTPNHLVLSNGSWKAAGRLVSNRSSLIRALASGSANLPYLARGAARKTALSPSNARAVPTLMKSRGQTCAKALRRAARPALAQRRAKTEAKTTGNTRTLFPTFLTGAVCSTGFRRVSRAASPMPKASPVQTTGVEASACLSRGQPARKVGGCFSPMSLRCRGGTCRRLNSTGLKRTATMNRAISGSLRAKKTRETSEPSPTCKRSSISTSRVFDIANAGPRNRFTIKTDTGHLIVHNCGFGGWIGSWRAFDPDADSKTDDQIIPIIVNWRDASPAIVAMWGGQRRKVDGRWRDELYGIEGAFVSAVQNPGREFFAGPLSFRMTAPFGKYDRLKLRLPSGRELTYHQPRLVPSDRRPGTLSISYMTDNSNPKYGPIGWIRMETWGSRVFENAVQAIAHCIMRFARANLEANGYPIVQEVYDEAVAEVRKGFGSIEEFERIMGTLPRWAAFADGEPWPIRASGGWAGRRYRKS